MPPKRLQESPRKGKDICAACDESLDEESSAMNCDICKQWLCIDCLEISKPEYNLLTKMTRRLGCEWKCPVCKGNAHSGASAAEIQAIVNKTLEPLEPAITAVQDLDIKIKNAVKQSFSEFKEEFKKDIDAKFKDVETRITSLEEAPGAASNPDLLQKLIKSQVESLKDEMNQQLESHVRILIAEDRDKQRRKLNILAFGVLPQPNDETFISDFLCNEYGLQRIAVKNVRRLVSPNNSRNENDSRKASPIIFSVDELKIKKVILQKSYERKGTGQIQFRNDVSKADRIKRTKLYEVLHARQANGEENLVIRGNRIVPKNVPTSAAPAAMDTI